MGAEVRAMAIFHGPSGLPEDRIVNTWHFTGLGGFPETMIAATELLQFFYIDTGDKSKPVIEWMSPWIQSDYEIRCYDMTLPKDERAPYITAGTLPARGTNGLPEECALVLSFAGAGVANPRRRGRLYIGPLADAAVTHASSAAGTRPTSTFTLDVLKAAKYVLTHGTVAVWSIRSSLPSVNYVPVHHGWVDNALDTQRRRGPKSDARSLFSSTTP